MSTEPNKPRTTDRLDSWKEIAQYLNRDVRTVQRWEQTSGLPVHRLVQHGQKRGTVYAFQGELVAWLNTESHDNSQVINNNTWHRARVAVILAISLVCATALWQLWPRNTPTSDLRVIQMTDYSGVEQFPFFSPDGSQLAFSWNGRTQNNFDIYIKDTNSTEPLRLTSDPAFDGWPAWSPDGRFIAFLRSTFTNAKSDVMLIPTDGGPERKVAEFYTRYDRGPKAPSLGWTPDSQKLIVPFIPDVDAVPGLAIMTLDDLEIKPLTLPASEERGDCCSVPSPDGRTLAFLRSDRDGIWNIYLIPFEENGQQKQTPTQLTFEPAGAWDPMWTADGKELLYRANRQGTWMLWRIQKDGSRPPTSISSVGPIGSDWTISRQDNRLAYRSNLAQTDLWRTSADGNSNLTRLVSSRDWNAFPTYSPDGKKLAFISTRFGIPKICITQEDGTELRELEANIGTSPGPISWAPDSSQLAFSCRYDSNEDVCVLPVSGGSIRRVTSNPAKDIYPTWSHDGDWIYISSNRSGSFQIWKIPSSGSEIPALKLTEGGGFGPRESADGKVIYYSREPILGSLWQVPVMGGGERQVGSMQLFLMPNHFAVSPQGIFYASSARPEQWFDINLYRFATEKTEQVARIEKQLRGGLSISPDGHWLSFPAQEGYTGDIFVVEDFK